MASLPAVGSPAPDFTLPSTADTDVTLSQLRGRNVLLAFFPLAFTKTCTREMCAFTEDYGQFQNANTVVLPISVDSVPTLKEFKAKERISVDMPSGGVRAPTERELRARGGIRVNRPSDSKRDGGRRYATLREDRFFPTRAYVLIDRTGVVRWTFREDPPGTRRENAELLQQL